METTPFEVCESFSEEITVSSSDALLRRLAEHASHGIERVVLDVSSPGGEVLSAVGLYEELRSTSIELVTRNVGEVASMGNLVFLAGDRRLISPEATFLLHPIVFNDSRVPLNAEDLCEIRTRFERSGADSSQLTKIDRRICRLNMDEKKVQKIFEQRTHLTSPKIKALVHESKPFGAADAIAFGIAHEIVMPADRSFLVCQSHQM
jgi:ATP-dependent protease ClpP protease subunit